MVGLGCKCSLADKGDLARKTAGMSRMWRRLERRPSIIAWMPWITVVWLPQQGHGVFSAADSSWLSLQAVDSELFHSTEESTRDQTYPAQSPTPSFSK
jgi:hypothetical protein